MLLKRLNALEINKKSPLLFANVYEKSLNKLNYHFKTINT